MKRFSTKAGFKAGLAIVLCCSMLVVGCTDAWVKVALADLPVLLQMAVNIAGLVTTLQNGGQLSAAESASIQAIGTQANGDLTLIDTLYNSYKSAPSAATLQKIVAAANDVQTNLPAELAAANIKNAVVQQRVSAAVNLIVTTVGSFAMLVPAPAPGPVGVQQKKATAVVLHPADLRKQWNATVCAPTGNHLVDAVLAKAAL